MRNRIANPFSRLLLVLLLAGCGLDAPGPTSEERPVSLPTDLVAREASEKARIAARLQSEQAIYDSLKVEWQRVLNDTTGAYSSLLICDPLQYVATVKIVGPEGADVDFGPHKLRIPAGALTAPTVITAEAPTSLEVVATLSPPGTVFADGIPATLELSYKHCRNPSAHIVRVGHLDASGDIAEWPSQDHPALGLVHAWIEHFSSYIVAY